MVPPDIFFFHDTTKKKMEKPCVGYKDETERFLLQPDRAYLVIHRPFVKSGMATGCPPIAMDCSERTLMHIQEAAS